jgi:hypothetical protein
MFKRSKNHADNPNVASRFGEILGTERLYNMSRSNAVATNCS